MKQFSFRFGNEDCHRASFSATKKGPKGHIFARKNGGNETITVDMSEPQEVDLIEAAWDKNSRWFTLYLKESNGVYDALRIIRLANGQYLVWYLYHYGVVGQPSGTDAPADAGTVWYGTIEEAAAHFDFVKSDATDEWKAFITAYPDENRD